MVRNIAERCRAEAEFIQAKQEAERLARVKGQFLANMSHELRTPLNGVMGMTEIGRRRAADNPQVEETFCRILDSSHRLLGIIEDILNFFDLDTGAVKIAAVDMDLVKVTEEGMDRVKEAAERKGIELALAKEPGLPAACRSDPTRLKQVLLNLLSNAVKFTEIGRIEVGLALEGGMLVLRVSDTGIGMTAEQTERILQPFEQADTSSTRKYGGTDLGLAITQQLVALMVGDIRVSSALGVGSTFEVRLPYAEATKLP